MNFWQKIKKPIFVLAPMADVTDCAFRQIINKYGKPPVFWTEFVSADGLAHPEARKKLLIDLKYGENEHPIVAQIFGGKPENIKKAAKLCAELGFDGVDINMGCPDKSIEKQCAGAAMMKNPELAKEIIRSAREGAESASASGRTAIPVSVKTRIGYNKNEVNTWIRFLLEQKLPLLTVHLRTRKEMSEVPAHWELMKDIVALRDEVSPETLIFGNGDVLDLEDAKKKVAETGCDGAMLGRAIFGNPFLFANKNVLSEVEGRDEVTPDFYERQVERQDPTVHDFFSTPLAVTDLSLEKITNVRIKQKLEVMLEHTKLFEEMLGKHKNFAIMKKHYKAYVNGFDGAKDLRMKLMEAENAGEVEKITKDFLSRI